MISNEPRQWDAFGPPDPKRGKKSLANCIGVLCAYDSRMERSDLNELLLQIPIPDDRKILKPWIYIVQVTSCSAIQNIPAMMSTRDFDWKAWKAVPVEDLEDEYGMRFAIPPDAPLDERNDMPLEFYVQALLFDHAKNIAWFHLQKMLADLRRCYPELTAPVAELARRMVVNPDPRPRQSTNTKGGTSCMVTSQISRTPSKRTRRS